MGLFFGWVLFPSFLRLLFAAFVYPPVWLGRCSGLPFFFIILLFLPIKKRKKNQQQYSTFDISYICHIIVPLKIKLSFNTEFNSL